MNRKEAPAMPKKPAKAKVTTAAAAPIGPEVARQPPGRLPDLRPLHGRWVVLSPLDTVKHGGPLYHSFAGGPQAESLWTYMAYGPFLEEQAFSLWLQEKEKARDPWFYALVPRGREACGMASYLRADPAHGVIEIGNIWLAPALQKTRAATEAIYLLMRHAFEELGVRRLEWKCDALNAPSRRAADRYGFTFEGVFRQHMVIKGRNRDTAWYAITDADWPEIRKGFETWLRPENFSSDGTEIGKLRVPGAGAKAGEKS